MDYSETCIRYFRRNEKSFKAERVKSTENYKPWRISEFDGKIWTYIKTCKNWAELERWVIRTYPRKDLMMKWRVQNGTQDAG